MISATAAIESAIKEIERLRQIFRKSRTKQVRTADERGLAKATASAWFSTHRANLAGLVLEETLEGADTAYRIILESSDRHCARSKYLAALSTLKQSLIALRTEALTTKPPTVATSDQAPDFSPLIGDSDMQKILVSRWNECLLCVSAGAALAATVMMGGLLEALLLARINRESNKGSLFTAKAAPKNSKTGSVKPLSEWMLNDFIQVLSELGWITISATAVGSVLREYRNYIHPQKQLSRNLHLKPEDAALFWEVSKNITRQVIS